MPVVRPDVLGRGLSPVRPVMPPWDVSSPSATAAPVPEPIRGVAPVFAAEVPVSTRTREAPPTIAEVDEVLAEIAGMPRGPNVAEVADLILDYRLRLMKGAAADV